MNYNEFHEKVYNRDYPKDRPHGWVQWKGTNVCMDIHCSCGHHGHFDGDFFYFHKCPKCERVFATGSNVALIPLTPEEIEFVAQDRPHLVKELELRDE